MGVSEKGQKIFGENKKMSSIMLLDIKIIGFRFKKFLPVDPTELYASIDTNEREKAFFNTN